MPPFCVGGGMEEFMKSKVELENWKFEHAVCLWFFTEHKLTKNLNIRFARCQWKSLSASNAGLSSLGFSVCN